MGEISYFSELYAYMQYPISGEEGVGLRNAQLGAIHAIAANDTIEENGNAMIVMPTGASVIIMTTACSKDRIRLSSLLEKINRRNT